MLADIEHTRLRVGRSTPAAHKAALGQYFTPAGIAAFMAGWFAPTGGACRLLDAGAGVGSLTSAFLARCASGGLPFTHITATAFELDARLEADLRATLNAAARTLPLRTDLRREDFLEAAVNALQFGSGPRYTHALLNPPYKKIANASRERHLLHLAGIETVNLYSGFVALALSLLAPGGQLVAIVPRSFCNGPYYRPFRDHLLRHAALTHLHLFASRTQAFKSDGVLQENLILRLVKGGRQGDVQVSTSTDDGFADLVEQTLPFAQIVHPGDADRVVHVPTDAPADTPAALQGHPLAELGLQVSTGPVVDFRLKDHLRALPLAGSVPLLYPMHLQGGRVHWPQPGGKKPNAIARDAASEKWLYPRGHYCVVRRLSSKEEKRRIVPAVVDPARLGDAPMIGFENHLNVFHAGKQGLPADVAHGLAAYLLSTSVDEAFRRFSGHTQVNATDLRRLHYPSLAALRALGAWALATDVLTTAGVDAQLARLAP